MPPHSHVRFKWLPCWSACTSSLLYLRTPLINFRESAAPSVDLHAGNRLDDDRAALLRGKERAYFLERCGTRCAFQHRHAETFRQRTRPRLVTEDRKHFRAWPDELDAGFLAGRGEVRILRKEAIARMHGIALRAFCGRDHAIDVEIGGRAVGAQRNSAAGCLHMQRLRVIARIDRDRAKAEFARGAGDAHGDLAAIGDEDFLEGH